MKYIIKNCDNYTNFDEDWTCRSTIQNRKGCYCCKNITDCLLKRIADKLNCFWCDAVGKSYDEEENQAYINQKIANIFDLFEIEENDEGENE